MGSSILAYVVSDLTGVHANFMMMLTKKRYLYELYGTLLLTEKKRAQLFEIVERPLVVINYIAFMNCIVALPFTR